MGEPFRGKIILIKLHCTSLICKIVFSLPVFARPNKYLYETSKPSIETDHNYSRFNWTLTIDFLFSFIHPSWIGLSNIYWQRSKIFLFFSDINLTVIVTELSVNCTYSISWDGTKTYFFWWTTKPRLPKSLTHFHTFLKHISNEYANQYINICCNFYLV